MNRKGKPCGRGNRSEVIVRVIVRTIAPNDQTERLPARPMQNRSIAGGGGFQPSSVADQQVRGDDWGQSRCVTMTYGARRVIVRGNRSGNRSAYSMAFVPKCRKSLFLWGKSNRSV